MKKDNDTQISVTGSSGSGFDKTFTSSFVAGNWHHIAFTLDQNGSAKLFVDGTQAGERNGWDTGRLKGIQKSTFSAESLDFGRSVGTILEHLGSSPPIQFNVGGLRPPTPLGTYAFDFSDGFFDF